MKHLEYNNILYDLQHGFRSSRSCETQLVSFIQDLAKSSDKNIQTDLIIMDFAKAFDKVSHKHLMYKISFSLDKTFLQTEHKRLSLREKHLTKYL
jgi:retron-type reverse transcriptase